MRITTTDRPKRYALFADDGAVVTTDVLSAGDYLATVLDVAVAEDENEFLRILAPHAATFPPLPSTGWLEVGAVYQYGDGAVIVRQGHERSIHPPEDTPALFMVWRADAADVLEWIAGEQVNVGTRRSYGGVEYDCLQAHVTQADWLPPNVPALWAAVVAEPEPSAEWAVGVAYKVGDVVTYQGREYSCRQAHTSIATWTPSAVLSLWLPL